jgi:peptidoglycan/LPS O-acetylase OafA/YrhL
LASLWVVLFHLEKNGAIAGLTNALPAGLAHATFGYGSAGVAVFFVLSGFVIAHSLEGVRMTLAELGRFTLRRSVRLDPPYWASIALATAVAAALAIAHHQAPAWPSAGLVAAHFAYAQELLRLPELQIVYWTLTYEVQFYLVFAASRLLDRRAFWTLYALALIAAAFGQPWATAGLFVNLWHGFFLGVLAYRAGYLGERAWPLLLLAAVTIAAQRSGSGVFAVPCTVTAIGLTAAARGRRLDLLSNQWWQRLGAVSYSLYLVHVPVLELLTGAWQRIAGRGFVADTAAAGLMVSACLGAATAFFWLVERPSHALAKRLGARQRRAGEHRRTSASNEVPNGRLSR